MKVRFAPSPTGYIHAGNCRTALVNWLLARKNGGTFLLRLDDTDVERSEDKYVQALLRDWAWLGLDYDEYKKQSDRMDLYQAAVEKLKTEGRLYACYETPEELEYKRKLRLKQGLPPLYDREALHLTEEKKAQYEKEGRKPHWRFLLKDTPIVWDDIVRGPTHFEGSNLSDPILVRESGTFVYILASVVDDIDLKITHIIRGEDHVSNTAIQLQLIEALGADPKNFQFAHLALLAGEHGEALGKSLGSLGVQDLRDQGIVPMAICSLLGKIGTSDAIHPYTKMQDLIDSFDLSHFGRATAKFSLTQLGQINKKILQEMSFEDIKKFSPVAEMTESFWTTVQHNIESLNDIKIWWETCHQKGDGHVASEDRTFIQQALDLLPVGPWIENPWDNWINALKDQTQRKGKSLFMPLRLALTGQEHGPELKVIFHLLGYDLVKEKLLQGLN